MKTIYLTGRHVLHHKLHASWHDEFEFAFNFKLISSNLFLTTKDIQAHVSCEENTSVTDIPSNSLINIPLTCSLATDYFTIHKMGSTSGLSVKHEIDFLKITFGMNTTDVYGVTHITLSPEKVHKIKRMHFDTTDFKDTTIPSLSPFIQNILISLFFSTFPWVLVCLIANVRK